MPENRKEIVRIQSLMRVTSEHQQLMKVNRLLLGFVFFLMMVVVILGVLFIPEPDASKVKNIATATIVAEGMNPVISAEVNNLKGQMIGLVSGSIESKLRTLEESIKTGAVDNSLGTIADLKNDIKVLRNYSEAPKKAEAVVSNQELAQEVSYLKKLIYMTLVSCGLMLAATAGIWLRYRRLPYEQIKRFLNRR